MTTQGEMSNERALGRIEAKLEQLFTDLQADRDELRAHQRRDLESMDILAKSITKQRDDTAQKFIDQDKARNDRFDAQDQLLNRAQGAGWVILGLLGVTVTILGGSLIAILGNWIKIH